MDIIEQARRAHEAARLIRTCPDEIRSRILKDFACELVRKEEEILSANREDVSAAEAGGMSKAMLDRLTLTPQRIKAMADGVLETASLPDPLHRILEERTLKAGVHLQKISVPIGTIGIIYESRPNVTADCAALCIKSGNACVLKGGKEAYLSSQAIISVLKEALRNSGVSEDTVMLIGKVSHEDTARFMACRDYLDVLIPRGSRRLIRAVADNAKVPVIETGAGICHVYVEKSADPDMAERIIINAKCQRPSVCNAMETLLIEEPVAESFLPRIASAMHERGVTMYADEACTALSDLVQPVSADSYDTEYNDLIMNIRIVKDTAEAVRHIEQHGTHHSDAIISEDPLETAFFMENVDSACVYHNASTRFTDGFLFGLGAEIGISTQKLHARGPMGLRELTTYTYHLEGKGEIRE